MKKVLLILFQRYADFEIAHALFLLHKIGSAQIISVSIDGEAIKSIGGLVTAVSSALSHIRVVDYDLILIPGGDGIQELLTEKVVSTVLRDAYDSRIPIASMCASAVLLAQAGILEGKRFTCLTHSFNYYRSFFTEGIYTGNDCEVSDLVVTAKGTAFAEFALITCQIIGMNFDDEQLKKWKKFCKGSA
ncbi:MAG: DJ-1/PfpI family protein [Bacillus sp. (in: firmicutes)]